ncbi:MAG TPA: phage tail sheath family protein [Cyclobacteriaceae bacterium]|nr:phage tail sheath family protein [Cyclobacteriaceae bacterium]
MANYRTPGVYVEEISKFPPSVAQVETAIPAFIGYTQRAADPLGDLNLRPKRITSLLEYEAYYGTAEPKDDITVTINETTDGSGNLVERTVNGSVAGPAVHNMYYAMQAFFANGGGPCYIVSTGLMSAAAGNVSAGDLEDGLNTLTAVDEVTLIVFPELQALAIGDVGAVLTAALNQCGRLQDRFVVADILPPGVGETILDAANTFRGANLPLDNLKYGAVYTPNVYTTLNYVYDEAQVTISRVVNGTTPEVSTMDSFRPNAADPSVGNSVLFNLSKAAIDRITLELPVAPLAVGQYASVDSTRGVWKAPANVSLATVVEPVIKITHEQQQDLNVSTTGKSINAVRTFAGKGTLIWGARTLAGNDNEWRYISVRRFFNMAEESVKKATEQFVFEPNDANTWVKVRAMIENFLLLQWRAGALAGTVPEDAFYVRVGLGSTMTALDILEGRMNVEIGMAVVRPAEFIILKFSHKMQES